MIVDDVAVEDAGVSLKYALGFAAKLIEQPHTGIAATHIMRCVWSHMVSQSASHVSSPYTQAGDCTATVSACTQSLIQDR